MKCFPGSFNGLKQALEINVSPLYITVTIIAPSRSRKTVILTLPAVRLPYVFPHRQIDDCVFPWTTFCLLLPSALQPTAGFGLSNNVLLFFPICHQLSPSSQSQHLKISFYFLFPSFPGSSPSSRPFQFLSEDLFGHPILLHSL